MSTPTSVPPPGWYGAGVAGQERWWNGIAWAEHTRPLQVAAPPVQLLGFSSPGNSLAFAIVSIVFGLPLAALSLLLIVTGNLAGLVLGLAAAVFGTLGGLLIWNYLKLSKQEAAARLGQQA